MNEVAAAQKAKENDEILKQFYPEGNPFEEEKKEEPKKAKK